MIDKIRRNDEIRLALTPPGENSKLPSFALRVKFLHECPNCGHIIHGMIVDPPKDRVDSFGFRKGQYVLHNYSEGNYQHAMAPTYGINVIEAGGEWGQYFYCKSHFSQGLLQHEGAISENSIAGTHCLYRKSIWEQNIKRRALRVLRNLESLPGFTGDTQVMKRLRVTVRAIQGSEEVANNFFAGYSAITSQGWAPDLKSGAAGTPLLLMRRMDWNLYSAKSILLQ